jgi:cobalt-zinc-cadmium efflux system protein
MEVDVIAADLGGLAGVADVHDVHVWTHTSGMHVATAHLVAQEGQAQRVLDEARELLRRDHAISHATLQVESVASRECHELDW